MVVTHFNPNLQVTVLTDVSRLQGLGFAVGNDVEGRFVTCRSKAGKSHHIADALSRAPLFQPADLDDMIIDTACTCSVTVDGEQNKFTAVLD